MSLDVRKARKAGNEIRCRVHEKEQGWEDQLVANYSNLQRMNTGTMADGSSKSAFGSEDAQRAF